MNFGGMPSPLERPELWPWSLRVDEGAAASLSAGSQVALVDALSLRGRTLREILGEHESAVVVDLADLEGQANVWATAFAEEFWDGYGMNGGFVVHDAWGADVPQIHQILSSMGVRFAQDQADQHVYVMDAPGGAASDPDCQAAQAWLARWRSAAVANQDQGIECLRLVERGGEYSQDVSPTCRARDLADFLRHACALVDRPVPTIEYVPAGGVVAHSCIHVSLSDDVVTPFAAEPAAYDAVICLP